jgi:hypothetical protein
VDSGNVFVMAGYIASVEQWNAFSDEWTSLLRLGPPHFRRISEFKMRDMRGSPLAEEQSELFYRVIERHVTAHISCTIKLDDLTNAFRRFSWPQWLDNQDILLSEYYNAFEAIVKGLAIEQGRLGMNEPIDMIFDENTNKGKCMRAWHILKHRGHPDIVRMLGVRPTFMDSIKTMPLQAADMLAYWLRECQLESESQYGRFHLEFPWKKIAKIEGIHIFYTPEMIETNFRNALLACAIARYGVRPEIINAIVSPRKASQA